MKTLRTLSQPHRLFSSIRLAIAVSLITAAAAMAFVATKPNSPSRADAPQNGVYIVQMVAAPAVSYPANRWVQRNGPSEGKS